MTDAGGEAGRWWRQTEHDLAAAEANARMGFHAVAYFLSQQAAEKALKARLTHRGEHLVIGHSAVELLCRCGPPLESEATVEAARRLDRFYIPHAVPQRPSGRDSGGGLRRRGLEGGDRRRAAPPRRRPGGAQTGRRVVPVR